MSELEEFQKFLEEKKKKENKTKSLFSYKKETPKEEKVELKDDIIPLTPEKKPSWFSRKKYKEWKKLEKIKKEKGDRLVRVKMQLNNGQFREFQVVEDNGSFIFHKARYILDHSMRYYIIDLNSWCYDFNEQLSLNYRKKLVVTEELDNFLKKIEEKYKYPLPPQLDANEMRTLLENSKLVDVENSMDPKTVERFMDAEVIKQVLQGAVLGRIFKIMFILIIVIAVLNLFDLIATLYHAGIFEKIKETFS